MIKDLNIDHNVNFSRFEREIDDKIKYSVFSLDKDKLMEEYKKAFLEREKIIKWFNNYKIKITNSELELEHKLKLYSLIKRYKPESILHINNNIDYINIEIINSKEYKNYILKVYNIFERFVKFKTKGTTISQIFNKREANINRYYNLLKDNVKKIKDEKSFYKLFEDYNKGRNNLTLDPKVYSWKKTSCEDKLESVEYFIFEEKYIQADAFLNIIEEELLELKFNDIALRKWLTKKGIEHRKTRIPKINIVQKENNEVNSLVPYKPLMSFFNDIKHGLYNFIVVIGVSI